jgi:hypothetical protein
MLGGVGIVASVYADIKGNTGRNDWSQAFDLVLFTGLAAMVAEGAPQVGIGIEMILLLNLLFPISGKPSAVLDLFSTKTVTSGSQTTTDPAQAPNPATGLSPPASTPDRPGTGTVNSQVPGG